MSDTIYEFELPNQTILQVPGAPSEELARAAARNYIRQNFPDDYARLSAGTPANTFWQSAGRSVDEMQGQFYTAAQAAGQLTGLSGLENWGRRGRQRNEIEAEAAAPAAGSRSLLSGIEHGSAGEIYEAGRQVAGQAIPSTVPTMGGALAGQQIGGRIGGWRGRVAGAIIGGALAQFPFSWGETANVDQEGNVTNPAASAGWAVPHALAGSTLDYIGGRFMGILGRAERRAAIEAGIRAAPEHAASAMGRIAQRGGSFVRGAAIGAATEAPEEVLQTVIERASHGQSLLDAEARRAYTEAALGGVVGGGFLGGTMRSTVGHGHINPPPPAPEIPPVEPVAPEPAAPSAAPAAATPVPEPAPEPAPAPRFTMPEAPAPFTTADAAADYLALNPDMAATMRNINFPTEDAATAYVNQQRRSQWQQQYNAARLNVIDDFLGEAAYQQARSARTGEITAPLDAQFRADQASIVLGNLSQAASVDNTFDMGRITPKSVAEAAYRVNGIEPGKLSRDEQTHAKNLLADLAENNMLLRNQDGTYRAATIPQQGRNAQPSTPETEARPEGAPNPEVSALWRGYTLNAGPYRNDPIVQQARDIASERDRPLTRAEFEFLINRLTPNQPQVDEQAINEPATEEVQAAPKAEAPSVTLKFQTEKGSTYEVNEAGQTIRTKRSEGPGQGTTYEPHNVLFVTPDQSEELLSAMRTGGTYRFGSVDADGNFQAMQPGQTFADIQNPTIGIFNADDKLAGTMAGERTPRVGLRPVEHVYGARAADGSVESKRHIGNTISSVTQPGEQTTKPRPTPKREGKATPGEKARDEQIKRTNEAEAKPAPNFEDLTNIKLPADAAEGAPILHRATRRILSLPWRLFSSPSVIATLKTEMAEIGGVAREVMYRKNEANIELEQGLAAFGRLSLESRKRVTRAWWKSSQARALQDEGLTAEEKQALTQAVANEQRAFDWRVEAEVFDDFNPRSATKPEDRTRLEEFWKRNEGKHLWEISGEELAAASPAGYAAMQELERLRNPYYMPSIADGSHFVAAYALGENGKRKPGPPLKMVAYRPLNSWQRQRGMADPEAAAVAHLRAMFPDKATHYVMSRGAEFRSNPEMEAIRNESDMVAAYITRLMNIGPLKSDPEAVTALRSLQRELDKSGRDRFFMRNEDILIPVTEANVGSYVLDMVPRYNGGVAAISARKATSSDFARASAKLHADDAQYWLDQRNYSTTPTEAFAAMRTATYLSLLGGAIDTAMFNFTQLLPAGNLLMRDGGARAVGYIGSASKDVVRGLSGSLKPGELRIERIERVLSDPGERIAYERALALGVMQPFFTNESRQQVSAAGLRRLGIKNAEGASNAVNGAARLLGWFQQTTEQTMRATTFLAAYRAATADPSILAKAGKLDNRTYTNAFEYAKFKTDQINFLTTKDDRALFQRAHPILEPMTQFMSFPAKTAELMFAQGYLAIKNLRGDPAVASSAALAMLGMIGGYMAMGGLWALPFMETLREIAEKLMGMVTGRVENFDAWLREETNARFGETTARFVSRGALGAPFGINVSRRVAINPIDYNDIAGFNALTLIGPSATFPESIARALEYARHGDYWNATAVILPRAFGNVVRGADIAFGTGEIRSQRGNTMITTRQIEEMGRTGIAVRTALGFQPQGVAHLREAEGRSREIARMNTEATTRLNDRIAHAVTQMLEARVANNPRAAEASRVEAVRIIQEQNAENQRLIREGRPEYVIRINNSAIQQRVASDFRGQTSLETALRNAPPHTRLRIIRDYALYAGEDAIPRHLRHLLPRARTE